MKQNVVLSLILFLGCFGTQTTTAQNETTIWDTLETIAVIDQKVMMPMRDGTRLCTDI